MELQKMLEAVITELQEAYEAGTLSDYMSDVLEIEYTMNLFGELRGVKMLVTYGNPNVYINTRTAKVEGYLDREHLELPLPYDVLQEIEGYILELI